MTVEELFESQNEELARQGALENRIHCCTAAGCISCGADGVRLARALTEMTPREVIDAVKQSGLRGRGAAGYPTGLKWELVAKQIPERKFVVCNADEGDPGAFMDRSVLEGDPHRVLEGMAIAGYAVGAQQAYIYVRGQYGLAIQRLQTAIKQAEREHLLGNRVLDTGDSSRDPHRGPCAYFDLRQRFR